MWSIPISVIDFHFMDQWHRMCNSLINPDVNVHSVLSYMQPKTSLRQQCLSVTAFLIMYTTSCRVICPRWSSQIHLVRKLLLLKRCLSMLCCVSKFQAHQAHQRVECSQVKILMLTCITSCPLHNLWQVGGRAVLVLSPFWSCMLPAIIQGMWVLYGHSCQLDAYSLRGMW